MALRKGLVVCLAVSTVRIHSETTGCTDSANAEHSQSLLQIRTSAALRPPYWSTKGGDPLHTGYSSFVAPENLTDGPSWSWVAPDHGIVRATPLLDGEGNIYQSTISGQLIKFSPSGSRVWTFEAGSQLPSTPVLLGDVLYVARQDCTVFALDQHAGTVIWNTRAGDAQGGDTSSLAAAENRIIVPCYSAGEEQPFGGNTFLAALDVNGTLLWKFRPDTTVYNALISIVNGSVIFEDEMGTAYRLQLSDGSLVWKTSVATNPEATTGGAIISPDAQVVYLTSDVKDAAGASHGLVSALRLDDGQLLWQKQTLYEATSGPAIGRLTNDLVGAFSVVVNTGPNPDLLLEGGVLINLDPINPKNLSDHRKPAQVIALDALTGDTHWTFDLPTWNGAAAGDTPTHSCLPDAFANPAIGEDGTVFVVGRSGFIYSISDKNGDGEISQEDGEVSSFNTKNGFQAAPAIGPGILAIAPCNGLDVFLSKK